MRHLRPALILVALATVALGLAYPLAMTGAAQVLFPSAADGSVVRHDGRPVGSRLVGQDFEGDASYFQSRPSATDYSADATAFANLGPNERELALVMRRAVAAYLEREGPTTPGLTPAGVPVDAATSSASGIDPHVSVANATIQANRVAAARDLSLARVRALVEEHTSSPLLGLGGPGSVHVLELNLALDAERP